MQDKEVRYAAFKKGLVALNDELQTAHAFSLTNKQRQEIELLIWALEHPAWKFSYGGYVAFLVVTPDARVVFTLKKYDTAHASARED